MNCKYIVSGGEDKLIKVWNIESMTEVMSLTGHNGVIRSVTITNDNKMIVSGSHDATLKLWNLDDGEVLHTFKGHEM